MFGCVAENALENPFLSCFSHFLRIQNKYYYRESKYINNTRNKNQNKKNQNHKTNRERGIERDWFVGATRRWTRWVDLKVVGRSRSGSLTGWVNRFVGSWRDLAGGRGRLIGEWVHGAISPVLGCDSLVLGCVIGAFAGAWMYDRRGVRVREHGEYRRTV